MGVTLATPQGGKWCPDRYGFIRIDSVWIFNIKRALHSGCYNESTLSISASGLSTLNYSKLKE
jgi:hypothetical protein